MANLSKTELKTNRLKRRMRRWWWTVVLVCIVMLSIGFLLLDHGGQNRNVLQQILQTLIIAAVILGLLWIGLPLNVHPDKSISYAALGCATWITIIRAMLIALLAGYMFQPWPHSHFFQGRPSWAPGTLYITASILDYLDGLVARKSHHETQLGAYLDINIDALGLVIAPLVAVCYGRLPAVYLSVSAAYYLFVIGIRLRKKYSMPVYALIPRRIARVTAGLQMGFVGVALLPVFSPSATIFAAYFFMVPLLAGFIRDWCFVCGYLKKDHIYRTARMSPFKSFFYPLIRR